MAAATSSQPEEGFRGPKVCQIVGITYRQLDYWARTGLVTPSVASAKGSGTQRRYSYRDLLELKVVKGLIDAGVALQSARKAIDCLRNELGEDVVSANLVLQGSHSLLVTTGEEIIDLLKGGQGVLNIVPLSGVKDEIDAAITDLGEAKAADEAAASSAGDVPRAAEG